MQNNNHHMTRRELLKRMGTLSLMGLAAACAPATPAATTVPAAAGTAVAPAPAATRAAEPAATAVPTIKRGGTLNWGSDSDPISFDPHNRNNTSSTILRRHIYQSFTRHNPRTLAVEPALATKWEYTKPTEIMWTLREGVVFHNGQPFTADDAKWNVERLIDPKTASPFANWYAAIEKVEATGKYTLKMTLKNADPVLPGKFAAMVVSGFAPASVDPATLATKPIGTGPYKLTEYVANDHTTLARNGDYWEKGIPNIDTLAVKIVPQEDTRIAALRTGQMDFTNLSLDGVQRLANATNLNILKGTIGAFTVIKMHQRFKPFTDIRVRRALELALNKKDIIERARGGAATLTGPVVSGWEDYGISPDQLPYKTDLEQAKKLMAEAGYANGFEVACTTLPENHSTRFFQSIATAAEQWKQIGVKINLQPLELGAWLEKNNKLDYDMLIGDRGFRGDPIDVLMPHYHKSGNDNPIGYNDPQVEKWLEAALAEGDRVKRRDLYLQVQKKVMEDVPWIFLWAYVNITAVNKSLIGYDHLAFNGFFDLLATSWLDR